MTKKKIVKIEPMIVDVKKDAEGKTESVVMQMVQEPRYRNVPLDMRTHQRLMKLCAKKGFGARGQGAYVRILINRDFETEFSQ
jgi:hypothetical protein